jgi:hypothetical protein
MSTTIKTPTYILETLAGIFNIVEIDGRLYRASKLYTHNGKVKHWFLIQETSELYNAPGLKLMKLEPAIMALINRNKPRMFDPFAWETNQHGVKVLDLEEGI